MNALPPRMSLEQLLQGKGDLVDYFYNDTLAPHSRARPGLTPVPMEHTSWVEEQRAWREAAVLFDQSHHMPEVFLKGPDAFKLLNKIGVNSFNNFEPGRCRQFIGCNHQGQVIGESILYYLDHESFELVSGMPLLNWVVYHAETGGYDVAVTRDAATSNNPTGKRIRFRFGMDGPAAGAIFDAVVEGGAPDIKFFRTARVRIAGCDVLALRHGMAGHKGVEISGDFDDAAKVKAALLEAGRAHGLKEGGSLAYFSTIAESSWVAAPLPAIYTAPELKAYREWLPATSWEAVAQLGGSYVSDRLEDYYLTPYQLGAEKNVKFDHDFIGRAALEEMARRAQPVRRTLVWNQDDLARVFASLTGGDLPYKMLRLPVATYAYQQNDVVKTKAGAFVGTAAFCGYSVNEREVVSLARIAPEHAELGTELLLTWGEPNGGSRKLHVERHQQIDIRVTVAAAPFASTVRAIKHR